MEVTPNKKYLTEGLREVRIDKIKPKGVFCVVGAVKFNEQWFKYEWRKNGTARYPEYNLFECSEEMFKLVQKGLVSREIFRWLADIQLEFDFKGDQNDQTI